MITLLISSLLVFQVPVPMPSLQEIQLHQLVQQSEKQLKALSEILAQSRADTDVLEKAARALERLSSGIDQTLEGFQGTRAYEKALLDIQLQSNFEATYQDAMRVRERSPVARSRPGEQEENDQAFANLMKFQEQSVRANESDLTLQRKLQEALLEAESGFVPKIGVQAEIGQWQASTRISAQVTELIAAIHAMREELRALNAERREGGVNRLLSGANELREQQRTRGE